MKIYKISSREITIYHITTPSNAISILQNGFDPGWKTHFFTGKEYVKRWFFLLKNEREKEYENISMENIEKMDVRKKRSRDLRQYMLNHKQEAIEWGTPVIISITLPLDFFEANFSDSSRFGESVKFEELHYQDYPKTEWDEINGWKQKEYTKPILLNGVNCKMEIVDLENL